MMPVNVASYLAPKSLLAPVVGLAIVVATPNLGAALGPDKTAAPRLVAPPAHKVAAHPANDAAHNDEAFSPAPAKVQEPAAAARLAHDVPDKAPGEDYDVPIEWVISDGRMHRRPNMLTLDAGLWPDTLSFAAFWAIPVLPKGFIRHVNDSLDLEFGLMLAAMRTAYIGSPGSTQWQLWPAFGARWNFFLTRNWSTFVTFKLAGRIGLPDRGAGWFDVFGGLGATYRMKERAHLRLELNYPQGLVVGLSFPIGAL